MHSFSAGRSFAGFLFVACLGLALLSTPALSTSAGNASLRDAPEPSALSNAARPGKASLIPLAAQPLRFEQNQGQTDPRIDYLVL